MGLLLVPTTGVGSGTITIVVFVGVPVQPPDETVTVYVPESDKAAGFMEGLFSVDENAFGPVQLLGASQNRGDR
jgi:hypothetical protein